MERQYICWDTGWAFVTGVLTTSAFMIVTLLTAAFVEPGWMFWVAVVVLGPPAFWLPFWVDKRRRRDPSG